MKQQPAIKIKNIFTNKCPKSRDELALVDDLAGGVVEAGFFQPHGAVAEPVVLGHGLDERFFGRCLRLVLLPELGQEFKEVGLPFGRQHPEFAGGGESMTEIVARGGGLSRLRFWTGGELCVRLVRGDLRLC